MLIAVTGHRPIKLGGYSQKWSDLLVELAVSHMELVTPSGVITGMALGWDQAVATASVRCSIPFTAAVPFDGQESVWPEESKKVYNDLLLKAKSVVYVCKGGYEPWKMQARNEWMVAACDGLVALYDGSPGGTRNCVNYAMKKRKSVANLWGSWLQLIATPLINSVE